MFRRLVMAIFRLYMKHLVSSYTKHIHGLLIHVLYNCLLFHIQPEDYHYQAPKHVVVLYVIIKYIIYLFTAIGLYNK